MHVSKLMDTGQRWRSQRSSLTCSRCSHRDTGQDSEPVRLQYCLAISTLGFSVSCCREIKGQQKGRESTEKATNNPGRKTWMWVPDTRGRKEDDLICVRIKRLRTWWRKGSWEDDCLLKSYWSFFIKPNMNKTPRVSCVVSLRAWVKDGYRSQKGKPTLSGILSHTSPRPWLWHMTNKWGGVACLGSWTPRPEFPTLILFHQG